MESVAVTLDRVVTELSGALAGPVRGDEVPGLSDEKLLDVLRLAGEAQRRLDAVVAEAVATVEDRSSGTSEEKLTTRCGCRNTNELLQRLLRVDARTGSRIVKAARAVRRDLDITSGAALPARWPELRETLLDGVVGIPGLLAATGPIDQTGDRVGTVDRLRADAELAAFARGEVAPGEDGVGQDAIDPEPAATPEELRVLAQVIVAYLDPDGAEPAGERAMRDRFLTLGVPKDGVVPIRGALLPEVAGQLQRILDAFLSPRVDGPPVPEVPAGSAAHSGGDPGGVDPGGEGAGVRFRATDPDLERRVDADLAGAADTRTRRQKQHDALAAALSIAARHETMPTLGGAAPTLVVSVSAKDYATGRGWAHVDGIDVPVSVNVARHAACAGGVQRVLFDPEGRIIGIGVTDRLFTTQQRRAITLRDRTCVIPGCDVPATWCEIHHVHPHSEGGPTHTDNGVALCWFHHRTIDTSGWDVRMHNGRPHIRGPAWWDPHRRWREPQNAHRHERRPAQAGTQ